MEVFDLTRGTTTGTVRIPAKAGETSKFKIRSTKTKKVNGKSQTPERIAFTYAYGNQGIVRASWKTDPSNAELYIVTLLVIGDNTTTSERTLTLPFTQEESGNVLNLTVIQEAKPNYFQYFVVGQPSDGGIMKNDPATLTFESHLVSTTSVLTLIVLKVEYDGNNQIVAISDIDYTETFEVTLSKPINDGFRLYTDQGTNEIRLSTIGGPSGTWFGTINISFSYGSIISSNDIELYQR